MTSSAAPRLLPAALTAALLCALPSSAQESNVPGAGFDQPKPAAQQTTAPTLHVYSRETVVDVLVTDSKGQPIRGLTRDDFSVKEDNKPQPIRSFLETRSDTHVTTSHLPKLPPNVYTNRQPPPASGSVNILLLDELNTPSAANMIARQEAIKYLKTMPAGTQVALLGLGNGLQILQGFTSDPNLLIAAITDKKNGLLTPSSVGVMPSCDAQDLKNRMTLEALREIAAFVAGTRGRKNLIWFSVGMQSVIFPVPMLDPPMPCLPDYTDDLHRAYDLLTSAQVAVYSIDPRGVTPNRRETAQDRLAMEAVAEATGGGAFYNTNDLTGAIAKTVDAGTNYYTLSYVPPGQKYDGRHHTINIKVDRPGVHLVYRDDYYAEDPAKIAHAAVPAKLASTTPNPTQNTMNASMARFAPTATQLIFDVKLAPTTTAPRPTDPPVMGFPADEFKTKPLTRYDILYTIPSDQLTFTTAADGTRTGSIQFAAVASDVFGKLITSVSRTLQLPFSPDEYQHFLQSPFQFLQQIDLPAGESFVRIGILDQASNQIGTIEIPLTVPKTQGAP